MANFDPPKSTTSLYHVRNHVSSSLDCGVPLIPVGGVCAPGPFWSPVVSCTVEAESGVCL